MNNNLIIYKTLDRFSPLKSFTGKIMIVAFLGIHVPLLTLLFYFLVSHSSSMGEAVSILVIALIATLGGTGVTLFILHSLLYPVRLTSYGLRNYLENNQIPELPKEFKDDVGKLMADTNYAVKKLDDTIKYIVTYDQLTGLPNTDSLENRIKEKIGKFDNDSSEFSLSVINIHNFKDILSIHGKENSDLIIKQIANLIGQYLNKNELFYKLEGSEFAIIQKDVKSPDSLLNRFTALDRLVSNSIQLNDQIIKVHLTVGITIYSKENKQSDLISQAHSALQNIDPNAGSRIEFFSDEIRNNLKKRITLENDLIAAISKKEFQLFYQPQIELKTNLFSGVESLIRWKKDNKMISPLDFIPIAEKTKLIIPIGEWVIFESCRQASEWVNKGMKPFKVAINLSSEQIKLDNIVSTVEDIIKKSGVDNNYIQVEITESVAMENIEKAIKTLNEFKELGISIALDDFGTGYSSLSYLKSFPISTLKIDQSFVKTLPEDKGNLAIASTIITLGKNLNMNTLAEGVETEAQLTALKNMGCDQVQGYYFSRPLPAEELESYYRNFPK